MAKIFISFVHEDQPVAEAVQRFLSRKLELEQPAFLSSDTAQVSAGEVWFERIKTELATAQVVLMMLSKRSVGRPWINFEAGAAWLSGKVLIPVCYGKMSKDQLPAPYSTFQSLNLSREQHQMATSIARHLGLAVPISDQMERIVKQALGKEDPLSSFEDTVGLLSIDNALKDFRDA